MFNPIALAVRESLGVVGDGNHGKLSHYRTRGRGGTVPFASLVFMHPDPPSAGASLRRFA